MRNLIGSRRDVIGQMMRKPTAMLVAMMLSLVSSARAESDASPPPLVRADAGRTDAAATEQPAESIVVNDGVDFTVDLGAARPCVAYPKELRRAKYCESFEPQEIAKLTSRLNARSLAMALVRLSPSQNAIVGVSKEGVEVTTANAQELFRASAKASAKTAGPNVEVRESNIRFMLLRSDASNTMGARGAIDIKGGSGMWSTYDHITELKVRSYSVSMMGPGSAAAEMDKLLDEVARTVVVAAAPPTPSPSASASVSPPPAPVVPVKSPKDDSGVGLLGALVVVPVVVYLAYRRSQYGKKKRS